MADQSTQRQREIPAPKLTLGQVVPPFALPGKDGTAVRTRDYKGRRNLVLYFMHSAACAACVDRIRGFAGQYREYQELDAEVLVIAPDALPAVELLVRDTAPPFPVLSDASGEVSERFVGKPVESSERLAGIFVTDRYGALYHQSLARRDADLPDQSEILGWLLFVGIQCEECGVPEWPAR